MSERQVYVVKNPENDSKMPGGFCMHDMGPDKITVEPGKRIPESWMYPATLKSHVAKGDMKYADGKAYKEPETKGGSTDPEESKSDGSTDDSPAFTEAMREEHCIYAKSDIKDMSRPDLDGMVTDIEQETGVAQPKFAKREDVIDFLTSGVN